MKRNRNRMDRTTMSVDQSNNVSEPSVAFSNMRKRRLRESVGLHSPETLSNENDLERPIKIDLDYKES